MGEVEAWLYGGERGLRFLFDRGANITSTQKLLSTTKHGG
jgi:hypothetical protein